jgi:hypothetical protein
VPLHQVVLLKLLHHPPQPQHQVVKVVKNQSISSKQLPKLELAAEAEPPVVLLLEELQLEQVLAQLQVLPREVLATWTG